MTRGGLWGLLHRHIGVRAEGMILAAAIWGLIGFGGRRPSSD